MAPTNPFRQYTVRRPRSTAAARGRMAMTRRAITLARALSGRSDPRVRALRALGATRYGSRFRRGLRWLRARARQNLAHAQGRMTIHGRVRGL